MATARGHSFWREILRNCAFKVYNTHHDKKRGLREDAVDIPKKSCWMKLTVRSRYKSKSRIASYVVHPAPPPNMLYIIRHRTFCAMYAPAPARREEDDVATQLLLHSALWASKTTSSSLFRIDQQPWYIVRAYPKGEKNLDVLASFPMWYQYSEINRMNDGLGSLRV